MRVKFGGKGMEYPEEVNSRNDVLKYCTENSISAVGYNDSAKPTTSGVFILKGAFVFWVTAAGSFAMLHMLLDDGLDDLTAVFKQQVHCPECEDIEIVRAAEDEITESITVDEVKQAVQEFNDCRCGLNVTGSTKLCYNRSMRIADQGIVQIVETGECCIYDNIHTFVAKLEATDLDQMHIVDTMGGSEVLLKYGESDVYWSYEYPINSNHPKDRPVQALVILAKITDHYITFFDGNHKIPKDLADRLAEAM